MRLVDSVVQTRPRLRAQTQGFSLHRIKEETDRDEVYLELKKLVMRKGWPKSMKPLGQRLRPYWGVHNDMSKTVDGWIQDNDSTCVKKTSSS